MDFQTQYPKPPTPIPFPLSPDASPDSVDDLGVPAHAQIIVAAPHGDVTFLAARVIHRIRELVPAAHHLLKHAVGVVALLLLDLVLKEVLVVKQLGLSCNEMSTGR